MTPTRNGKIAHLPLTLRNELNHRLDNGIPGRELILWLNADPEVQRILAQYFRGRRITQQNLSEWRCGGYQDWVKLQETRYLTLQLAKEPENVRRRTSTPGKSPMPLPPSPPPNSPTPPKGGSANAPIPKNAGNSSAK